MTYTYILFISDCLIDISHKTMNVAHIELMHGGTWPQSNLAPRHLDEIASMNSLDEHMHHVMAPGTRSLSPEYEKTVFASKS